jgi:tetratricopeptide (TPR) repeat protein
MAEGLLGGVLGEDDEKSEVDAPDALAGAEAFASAVAAKLAGSDPEVARDTSAFLKKQARLLDTQNGHLEDEHALRVAHLHNQLREEKVRRFGLRLRVGLQLFVVLVATVIGIGIAVMIRDAVTSRRVVFEFDAPPALAARGVTGNLQAGLDADLADAAANAGVGTMVAAADLTTADGLMRLHDQDGAELALKTIREDPHDPTIAALTHFVRGRLAAEVGDAARAASELEAFGAAYADPVVSSNYPGYNCWIAPAEEAAGHPEKSDAVLKTAGTFVDCYRFRADVLDGRSDWSGAQKAYADAVALAPDLPAAYYSWGLTLAKHGDLDGAAAKLKDSNQRGPHWADPLKAWGDVLAKQGKTKEALAKYDEALKYAPNWKQLNDAREAAAKQKT